LRFAPGTPLALGLAADPSAPMPAGRLAWDAGLAQLEWSSEVLARKLAVAALYYPPEPGVQAARGGAFGGLQGFLADSLPEGWGYLLMRKRLAKLGIDIAALTPLERLALVGQEGRGALVFSPATTPAEDVETLDLDILAAESAELLRGEESALADTLAGLAGGSGGARPKVHVGFDGEGRVSLGPGEAAPGYAAWLVKFAAPEDPADIGPIEEAYARMAEAAGLRLSEHRLIPARAGPGYFATRRFDRPEGGGRVHMVSLAGAIEAPSTLPSTSYDMFLRATQAITRHAGDVAEVFRRMVFNILACNRDDHTRQHAFLMDVLPGSRRRALSRCRRRRPPAHACACAQGGRPARFRYQADHSGDRGGARDGGPLAQIRGRRRCDGDVKGAHWGSSRPRLGGFRLTIAVRRLCGGGPRNLLDSTQICLRAQRTRSRP
jgi:serine/threonine-protein kinase HipA